MRWTWIGLVIVSTIGYLWMNPPIVDAWLRDEEEEDRGDLEENLEGDEEVGEEEVLLDTTAEDDCIAEAHA